jgi:hypothetical protein
MNTIRIKFPVDIKAKFVLEGSEKTETVVGGAHYVGPYMRDFVDVVPNTITEHGKFVLQHVGLEDFNKALWIGTGENPGAWLESPIYNVEVWFGGAEPINVVLTSDNYTEYLGYVMNTLHLQPHMREFDPEKVPTIPEAGVVLARREHKIRLIRPTDYPSQYAGAVSIVTNSPIQVKEIVSFIVPGQATAYARLKDSIGNPITRTIQPGQTWTVNHILEIRFKGVEQQGVLVNAWLAHTVFARKMTTEANSLISGTKYLPYDMLSDQVAPPRWTIPVPKEDVELTATPMPLSQPIDQWGTRYILRGIYGSGWLFRPYSLGSIPAFYYPILAINVPQPFTQLTDVFVDFIPNFWSDTRFVV